MHNYPHTMKLPSGKHVRLIRPVKVRDAVYSHRVVATAEAGNAFALALAALAPTLELDGKAVFYEDLLELDLDDLTVLAETVDLEKKLPLAESN